MKVIKIKKSVFDVVGNEYNEAFVSFRISTQPSPEMQQKMQQKMQQTQEAIQQLRREGKTDEAQKAQMHFQQMQQRGFGVGQTVEEIASRGQYVVEHRAYKSIEMLMNSPRRPLPLCKENDGVQLGTIVVELTPEECEDFGIKILTQKTTEFFEKIFGEENVELIDVY
jgi:membrane-associated HD superfamily phosphohydrolase